MKLVTIVTEGLLKDQITELLKQQGVRGFTITRADGEGSRGINASHWEGPNLKIETIVTDAVGRRVMDLISEKYFDHYAVVAWLTDVEVLRGEKFSPVPDEDTK
ncbi:P-II family nitrogen regulator [Sulfuriroseicoccus oceanibius]|uniref:Nitrogen regulatory protein P-II n=1 Tax=Sulfuriroseicoccus oceanibius TaxID=2707525 RepID=A0A7T7F2F8_9BACT|nr:P-II family nitrogen regulator [Sulfuriroseicoccus oceanibius]QQL45576.1 hypothetical protein G3M56_003025 [Sulfuriroseicoccus oceanibius]